MPRVALLALLLAGAAAGCLGRGVDDDGPTDGPAVSWAPGDRWTYRLLLTGGTYADEWSVRGPTLRAGREVVEVVSRTTGPGLDTSEVGSFDARTLALVHVESEGLVIDFDPAEAWLLPAEDRSYQTVVSETRPQGTTTGRVSWSIDHQGGDTVETAAGTFAAERFAVRRTTFGPSGSQEQSFTYWWAPAAANVVLQTAGDGTRVRELTSYGLADVARTFPQG